MGVRRERPDDRVTRSGGAPTDDSGRTCRQRVQALHDELEAAGVVVGAVEHPFYMPAGEIRLEDPDGYVLLVGQLDPDRALNSMPPSEPLPAVGSVDRHRDALAVNPGRTGGNDPILPAGVGTA